MTSRLREPVQEARNVRLCPSTTSTTTTSTDDVQEVAAPAAASSQNRPVQQAHQPANGRASDTTPPPLDHSNMLHPDMMSIAFSGTDCCPFESFDFGFKAQSIFDEGLLACARQPLPENAYEVQWDASLANGDAAKGHFAEDQPAQIYAFNHTPIRSYMNLNSLMNTLGANRAAQAEACDAFNERVRWYLATVIAMTMNLKRMQQLMAQAASPLEKKDGMIFVFDTGDVTRCVDTDLAKCHPTRSDLLRLYSLSGNQIQGLHCTARDAMGGASRSSMTDLYDALRSCCTSDAAGLRKIVVVLPWVDWPVHGAGVTVNPYRNFAVVEAKVLDNTDFRTFCKLPFPKEKKLEHLRVGKSL